MNAKTEITSEIRINAPKEKVWAIIADLGGVQNFHPGVKKSYYTSANKKGIEASRVCELLPIGSVEESAVQWHEGEGYVLQIFPLEKAPPFKKAFGRFTLKKDGQRTCVIFTVEYSLKFGPIGRLMNKLLVKPQFRKVVPAVLTGLKHYTETGEVVTPEVLKKPEKLNPLI